MIPPLAPSQRRFVSTPEGSNNVGVGRECCPLVLNSFQKPKVMLIVGISHIHSQTLTHCSRQSVHLVCTEPVHSWPLDQSSNFQSKLLSHIPCIQLMNIQLQCAKGNGPIGSSPFMHGMSFVITVWDTSFVLSLYTAFLEGSCWTSCPRQWQIQSACLHVTESY